MLTHATTLYAYWGNRREGLEATAERMMAMLDDLKPVHPAFNTWLWEHPQDEQWVPYGGQPCTPQGLVTTFQAELADPKVERPSVPGFGFSTSAWNGEKEVRAGAFRCSLENTDSPAIFPNLVSFTLRSRQFGDPTMICTKILTRVLAAVAKA
jgi:hypothetical protein